MEFRPPQMLRPPHPLDGAFLRWERADIHLAEAQELIRGWGKECEEQIVGDDNGKIWVPHYPEIPVWLPVIVSDAVHNLRAALDYLVYELAKLDSDGRAQDNTQFLIEDFEIDPRNFNGGFHRRKKRHLKGLSRRHIDAIENFQPYKGIEWTETLREISNPDKHRHLSVLTKDGRPIQISLRFRDNGRLVSNDFKIGPEGPEFLRFDPEVDANQTIAITLPKRGETALMPTLRELEAEVYTALVFFKTEFEV